MSINQDEPREAEITFSSDRMKAKGEVFKDAVGGWFVKLTARQLADRPELKEVLSAGEQPETVWARITDRLPDELIQEGQSLMAWVRVKQSDGKFVTKTALFSLGAVAAITITRRVVQHYQSR